MRIIFVQHLNFINGPGGTEKICSFLANHFDDQGHEVIIATCQDVKGKAVFPLNKKVKVENIYDPNVKQKIYDFPNYKGNNPFLWLKYKVRRKYGKFRIKITKARMGGEAEVYKWNLLQRSRIWGRYIEDLKPDLIITMSISSLLEITYQNDFQIPIINSVNGRPDYDYTDILGYRSSVDMEHLKKSFQRLSGIQVLFEGYKEYLPTEFHGVTKVIPNPVPQFNETLINYSQSKKRYSITNIASLDLGCKQQDAAINAFSSVAEKYPNWDLHFWGIGRDEEKVKNKIEESSFKERIFLHGFTNDPIEKLKESDIFVFPSKFEGFPLALTEAMSVGLPVVGLSTCSGVNQLISDKKNGILADQKEHISAALNMLMESSELRAKLGIKAHEDMRNFDPVLIKQKWTELVNEVVNN